MTAGGVGDGERWPGFSYRSGQSRRSSNKSADRSRPRRQRAASHHCGQSRDPDRVSAGPTCNYNENAPGARTFRPLSLTVRACPVPLEEEEDDFISPARGLIASRRNRSSPTGSVARHRGEPGGFQCASDVSRCPRMRLLNHRCNPVTIMTTALLHRLARARRADGLNAN